MTDCVLQKVNLVKIEEATATRPRQTDLVQLKYVEYMLHQIHILLKVKRSMNVRELIVALYTVRNASHTQLQNEWNFGKFGIFSLSFFLRNSRTFSWLWI